MHIHQIVDMARVIGKYCTLKNIYINYYIIQQFEIYLTFTGTKIMEASTPIRALRAAIFFLATQASLTMKLTFTRKRHVLGAADLERLSVLPLLNFEIKYNFSLNKVLFPSK